MASAATAPGGPAAAPGPKRTSRGSGGKDAFDNAGNWGDDFPAADDWDNEEYTGSLADTKVFTARSSIGAPAKPAVAAPGRPQVTSDTPSLQQQQQAPQQLQQQAQQPQQVQQQQPPNSTVIGQNR